MAEIEWKESQAFQFIGLAQFVNKIFYFSLNNVIILKLIG